MRADADADDATSRPSTSTSASPAPFSHLTFFGGRGRGTRGDGASTNAEATPQKDCFSCRVLGVSACGVGAAAVMWEIYKEPRRRASHRYAMGAFATAFVAMGLYRAVM